MTERRVFGVRHHGPGCAQALVRALDDFDPEVVLVEGPPEADTLISMVTRDALVPPVALLVYATDQTQRAAFFPFNHYSPEWQALRWASEREREVRFMDLPQAIRMARAPEPGAAPKGASDAARGFTALAQAAGFDDQEHWWEHAIEQRGGQQDLLEAVGEAVQALRGEALIPEDPTEARREAWMRRVIRKHSKGKQRVAVVCGAWHAPALTAKVPVKQDNAVLKGLKRCKVAATWVPWTHSRMGLHTGYGAGVPAPGWYAHLWSHPDEPDLAWVTQATRLLRREGVQVSSGHAIAAVELARTLAALRERSTPGLRELRDALESAVAQGDSRPMQLLRDHMEIGLGIGQVPQDTPALPLARDIERQRRALRLPQPEEPTELTLDLRQARDRDKSRFLHRMHLLGVTFGELGAGDDRDRLTTRERWTLRWRVELPLRIVEASVWGTTLSQASTACALDQAAGTTPLMELTRLIERTLRADLPDATAGALQQLDRRAAGSDDQQRLMEALVPLLRILRYGDAQGTPKERLAGLVQLLFTRMVVGLPLSCRLLDADAADKRAQGITDLGRALTVLAQPELLDSWHAALRGLLDDSAVHSLLRGLCARQLLEAQVLQPEAFEQRATRALAPGAPPLQSAAWLEGVTRGSALVLLNQGPLWDALDGWLLQLGEQDFVAALPVLRRAFADFGAPERRHMHARVRSLGKPLPPDSAPPLNMERAGLVLPLLRQLLGADHG